MECGLVFTRFDWEKVKREDFLDGIGDMILSEINNGPSKIEWDLTNGPRSVSCDRAIRYSGLGVRSVGPVEDFLEMGCKIV